MKSQRSAQDEVYGNLFMTLLHNLLREGHEITIRPQQVPSETGCEVDLFADTISVDAQHCTTADLQCALAFGAIELADLSTFLHSLRF